MLFLTCTLIESGYVYDAVCVDIEGNFDLRDTAGSGSDTIERESAERGVVSRSFSFTLKNVDLNGGLTVSRCGEYLRFLYGDGGVSVDDLGANTAEGFDTERKGSYVKEEKVVYFAAETPPWIAAPMATHSSGLMPLKGSLPQNFLTAS